MSDKPIERRLDDFRVWFTDHGGYIHPDVEFKFSREKGVHLCVKHSITEPLPSSTLVILCPHAISLSAINAVGPSRLQISEDFKAFHVPGQGAPDFDFDLPADFLKDARPQCIGALWLCIQWNFRSESFWSLYLDILPTPPGLDDVRDLEEGHPTRPEGQGEIDTPLWWSADERAWFRGTNLEKGMNDLDAIWMADWNRWSTVLEAWAAERGLELTWYLFKWAISIFGSRAFQSAELEMLRSSSGSYFTDTYDPHALLFPGCDALNHTATTKNREYRDETGFGIICDDEPSAGEEIFNMYGPKGNGELLLSFGFCLEENIHDRFAIRLPQQNYALLDTIAKANSDQDKQGVNATSEMQEITPTTSTTLSHPLIGMPTTHRKATVRRKHRAADVENNTYFIRASSAHPEEDAEYPDSSDPELSHLAGFPIELLNRLSIPVMNSPEQAAVAAAPHDFSATDLYKQLGRRNELAVVNLLVQRLRMDFDRIQPQHALLSAQSSHPDIDARREARRACTLIYLEGQLRIIRENIDLLSSRLQQALLPTPSSPTPLHTPLLTLPRALQILRAISPTTHQDFTAGLRGALGSARPQAWRRERDEEDVFTLWLGLLFTMHANIAQHWRSSSSTGGGDGEAPLHRRLDAWLTALHRLHPPSSSEGEADEDETAQITAHTLTLLTTIRTQQAALSRIWDTTFWPPALLALCVRVVQLQRLVLRPERPLYRALIVEEEGLRALESEGKGGEGVEVVALCVELDGEGEEVDGAAAAAGAQA